VNKVPIGGRVPKPVPGLSNIRRLDFFLLKLDSFKKNKNQRKKMQQDFLKNSKIPF
jgi:hypothetical protein